ncbi:oligosaccharide flippase family protein [Pseudomonas neustonica]|uniref:oligosaccharide flippase family protein n=1 Tax=Pseudomonas neustonica TaxID=2487346 RepID=UPI003F485A69
MLKDLRASFAGAGARYLLQAGALIWLARLLPPDEFGVVAAAMIFIFFSFVVLEVGGGAIVASATSQHVNAAFTVALILVTMISLLVAILYFFLDSEINAFLDIKSSLLIWVLMPMVFLRGWTGAMEGMLSSSGEFGKIARSEVLSYFFGYFLVCISLAYFYKSYWCLVAGMVCQSLLHFFFLGRTFSFKMGALKFVGWNEFRYHASAGLGVMVNKLLSYGISQADNLYVNLYFGKYDLGIYSRAYQLMVVPTNFVGQVVGRVFIPRFRGEVLIFLRYQISNLLMSFLAVGVVLFSGERLILFLLGKQWVGVYPALLILSLAIYYKVSHKFYESVLIGKRHIKRLAYSNLIGFLVLMAGLYCLSPSDIGSVASCVLLASFAQSLSGLLFTYGFLSGVSKSSVLMELLYFMMVILVLWRTEWLL